MDPKLTILFLLIGTVLALSSFGDGAFDRMLRQFRGTRRR
jgi:hypothetical protein